MRRLDRPCKGWIVATHLVRYWIHAGRMLQQRLNQAAFVQVVHRCIHSPAGVQLEARQQDRVVDKVFYYAGFIGV